MDQYTRDKVLQKMTTERDLRNQMAYAMQEATAEGLEKGLVEGRAEGIVMVARNMLHQGIGVDVISTCTGLSASEIELL
jgi:predicted transposase/invertase (TIGR01784 family)